MSARLTVRMTPFGSWDELLEHVGEHSARIVWYKAPMDHLAKTVLAKRRGKGRRLRCVPLTNAADPFWADSRHLARFFKD